MRTQWLFILMLVALTAASNCLAQVGMGRQGTNVTLTWPSSTGEFFFVEQRASLTNGTWLPLAPHLAATVPGTNTTFTHFGALQSPGAFYRVLQVPAPFTFSWSGTNFTYSDSNRAFTGILLKPPGSGPFPAVIIHHGAGGTAAGYSLPKAREMMPWGMVCIGPTLTHAAGGETDPVNMGNCPENNARTVACANILASFADVDTNRIAVFGHSMGAFNTIGSAGVLAGRVRAGAITAGGVIPVGTSNATPTYAEASPVRAPFVMFHCDADPVVPASRSLAFQQILTSNAVASLRVVYSSNAIPNSAHWHNLHQDPAINTDVLTNTFQWFRTHGVLP
jgi:dienelactone hydrolase